ncbi:hypothetical protein CCDG5_0508 [[Clostridium] cellulosi]|uniref:SGNH hydrolase-type esterase domain-containing protein n=1 Tax=[Clostridium] cellulosi TaxID=29343 RepID=A0A078KJ49_9FIRM|nr:MAG: hypothetical protein DIU81_00330 [[Clostridium] cellulosi]CDZ23646.1 hypothetical protein CCDG5_0508 [[Clostridium] cellulosi]
MSKNRQNKHRGLKGNGLLTFVTVLLGCAVIVSIFALYKKAPIMLIASNSEASSGASSTVSSQTDEYIQNDELTQPNESSQAVSSSSPSSPSSSEVSKPSASSSSTSSESNTPVDLSKAVFIGDSLTDGLSIYGGIDSGRIFYTTGMTASSALYKEITIEGKSQTAADFVAAKKPKSIYIMLGSNDIVQGISAKKFQSYYEKLVDKIKSSSPNSKIYLESILPVTAKYEAKSTKLTNKRIESFNAAIKELCANKGVNYCDVAYALKDSDGTLLSDLSWDGFHLNKAGYANWIAYLKNH